MRAFALPGRYDLAILAFNTLNVLLARADAIACLTCVRRHLVPGGCVAIDVSVFEPARLLPATNEHVTRYRVGDREIRVTGNRTYDPASQHRRLELTIHDGDDVGHDVLDSHITQPWELAHLVERAGFAIDAVYGDYARGPLVAGSKQCIVVAVSPIVEVM
jgi:hypothetical protein